MSIRRILVPVDGSESSLRALDHASALAEAVGAELDLITVLSLGELDFYDGMYLTLDQVEQWQSQLKDDILATAQARVPGGVGVRAAVLKGRIVPTILERAASESCDLIVLGRTGKGRLERMLKGSVAQRISGSAPVPVTLVG